MVHLVVHGAIFPVEIINLKKLKSTHYYTRGDHTLDMKCLFFGGDLIPHTILFDMPFWSISMPIWNVQMGIAATLYFSLTDISFGICTTVMLKNINIHYRRVHIQYRVTFSWNNYGQDNLGLNFASVPACNVILWRKSNLPNRDECGCQCVLWICLLKLSICKLPLYIFIFPAGRWRTISLQLSLGFSSHSSTF